MKTLFPEIRRMFDLTDDEMHGYPEESILAVEESLGVRLPAMLRQFYLELGAHRMTSMQDHIVPLYELDKQYDADWIIFYVENQAVVCWGVKREDCAQDDPPVYVFVDFNDSRLEAQSVSFFLRTMLHHQAALSYYEYGAMSSAIDDNVTEFIISHFSPSDEHFREWLGLSIYASSSDSSIELSFSEDGKYVTLFIAAKTKEKFLALYEPLRHFDILWDSFPESLRDRK